MYRKEKYSLILMHPFILYFTVEQDCNPNQAELENAIKHHEFLPTSNASKKFALTQDVSILHPT